MRLKPFLYRKWSSYNGGKDKEGGLSRGYSLEIHDLCNFYFRLTLSISFLKLCGKLCSWFPVSRHALYMIFSPTTLFLWHHMQYWQLHAFELFSYWNGKPTTSSHLGYVCWSVWNLLQIHLSLQNWPSPSSSCSPVSWKICWMHP